MNKFYALFIFILSTFAANAAGWVQLADFGGVARHRTPMLTIGNKIYTGTGHYNGAGTNILFNDWWQYDPATDTWAQKADYGGGNCYHAAGFTIGSYGYMGTGRVTASGNTLTKDFFRYDPATNSWTQLTDFPGAARRGAVGFSIDGYGYIGTGEPQSGGVLFNDFYRYNPATDSWIQISSMPTQGRVSAASFELNGYGYVGTGGFSSWGTAQKDFWRYDPVSNTWQQMSDVGAIPRMEATGFSLSGKGYILCGDSQSSGTNYSDMYEFDPLTGLWTQLENFDGSARRYMAAAVYNGRAYVGLGTNGTNFKDFWTYDLFLSLLERDELNVDVVPYPNPVVDQLNIDITGLDGFALSEFKVHVYNFVGQLVRTIDVESHNLKVNFEDMSSGTYRYVLDYNGRCVKSGNILKR